MRVLKEIWKLCSLVGVLFCEFTMTGDPVLLVSGCFAACVAIYVVTEDKGIWGMLTATLFAVSCAVWNLRRLKAKEGRAKEKAAETEASRTLTPTLLSNLSFK